ncbi:MAG TPA: hypothetical protein VEF34_14170 [Syntrophobacteraceae bacterium]|nr:hypothetical protein [Syntrophobacteraceae bacterium]
MNIQYVVDNEGKPVAVQIPIAQWEAIKAELETYDSAGETMEIMADAEFLESIVRGREQASQRLGRRIEVKRLGTLF